VLHRPRKEESMPKRLLAAALTAVVSLGLIYASPALATTRLKGAGSSFANKFITSCAAKPASPVTVSYNPAGSGTGRTAFGNGTVDFGASDAASSISGASGYKYVPVVGGPVAIIFNLPGITEGDLNLDAATWAKILKGSITKWNDPAIETLQSSSTASKLPDRAIRVMYRATSSGTSENMTDYLRQNVPSIWTRPKNGTISAGNPAGRMPNGSIGAANSQALVTSVKNTSYSIGYADLSDAEGKNVAYAKLKNAAGAYVLPTSTSASTFLGEFSNARYFNRSTGAVTLDFTKSIPGAYNMSLLTYAIVKSTDGATGSKQTEARNFVEYLLTTCGPQSASGLGYSPISGELKTKALALVQ